MTPIYVNNFMLNKNPRNTEIYLTFNQIYPKSEVIDGNNTVKTEIKTELVSNIVLNISDAKELRDALDRMINQNNNKNVFVSKVEQ